MNQSQWFASDTQFNLLYPFALQLQAGMHWTPLHIARQAAAFLAAEKNKRVLDIGCGAGKFCLTGAYYQPDCFFYGVEQRKELVKNAETAAATLLLQNVSFTTANINTIDFTGYDHFYFFNSFFENIESSYRIDEDINYSKELYHSYNRYVYKQLDKKPSGTRLATFHSTEEEKPGSYHEVGSSDDGLLKFWIKI